MSGLGDRSEEAMTETLAIHLLRSQAGAEIEYEPPVKVGDRSRKPDLRAKWGSSPWVYGEVAKPNDSEMKQASATIMKELADQVRELSGSFSCEVFLRRPPKFLEMKHIRNVLLQVTQVAGQSEMELPDGLGRVFVNFTEPGNIVVDDHGEGYRPGIGVAAAVLNDAEHRHVMVRLAYSDDRAERFLRSEARQLPTEAPTIVMLYTGRATGAMHNWAAVMKRQFRPEKHTRVGGVCLFEAGLIGTEAGETWRPETQMIVNPHTRIPLPAWVSEALTVWT